MLIDNAPKTNKLLGKVGPYERDRLLILALRRLAEKIVGECSYLGIQDDIADQLIDGQVFIWLREAYIDMYPGQPFDDEVVK